MSDLYGALGVKAEASRDEIKRAYRTKANELHPDKGGNGAEFALAARAYEVLSDDEKRKRYDKTGIETDINTANQQAGNTIQAIFNDFIQHIGIENIIYHDVVSKVREKLDEVTDKLKKQKGEAADRKKALKKVITRIKHKDRDNFFTNVIRQKINNESSAIEKIGQRKEVLDIAKKMLKAYGFESDIATPSIVITAPAFYDWTPI